MNFYKLTRDKKKALAAVTVKGKSLVATQALKIVIPRHYASGKLGAIESSVRALGIYALVVDNKYYGVNVTNGTLTFTPSQLNVITINDIEYLEMAFDAGDTILPSLDIVKNSSLLFLIYDEITAKGKSPAFFNYQDLARVFDTARDYTGLDLFTDHAILEMMQATRCRNPIDRTEHFRQMLKKQDDLNALLPSVLPLRSVAYGATSTAAKLLGSGINEGVTGALVNPTEKLEDVERLLLS